MLVTVLKSFLSVSNMKIATRPKGIGTGSDSEPLSVQRIELVKDPSKMPFWCATWFTKVTNKHGLHN